MHKVHTLVGLRRPTACPPTTVSRRHLSRRLLRCLPRGRRRTSRRGPGQRHRNCSQSCWRVAVHPKTPPRHRQRGGGTPRQAAAQPPTMRDSEITGRLGQWRTKVWAGSCWIGRDMTASGRRGRGIAARPPTGAEDGLYMCALESHCYCMDHWLVTVDGHYYY